ncbi:MAG: methyltransferase domain-containing protein, partial [Candidatus Omnitrophota bacterium]
MQIRTKYTLNDRKLFERALATISVRSDSLSSPVASEGYVVRLNPDSVFRLDTPAWQGRAISPVAPQSRPGVELTSSPAASPVDLVQGRRWMVYGKRISLAPGTEHLAPKQSSSPAGNQEGIQQDIWPYSLVANHKNIVPWARGYNVLVDEIFSKASAQRIVIQVGWDCYRCLMCCFGRDNNTSSGNMKFFKILELLNKAREAKARSANKEYARVYLYLNNDPVPYYDAAEGKDLSNVLGVAYSMGLDAAIETHGWEYNNTVAQNAAQRIASLPYNVLIGISFHLYHEDVFADPQAAIERYVERFTRVISAFSPQETQIHFFEGGVFPEIDRATRLVWKQVKNNLRRHPIKKTWSEVGGNPVFWNTGMARETLLRIQDEERRKYLLSRHSGSITGAPYMIIFRPDEDIDLYLDYDIQLADASILPGAQFYPIFRQNNSASCSPVTKRGESSPVRKMFNRLSEWIQANLSQQWLLINVKPALGLWVKHNPRLWKAFRAVKRIYFVPKDRRQLAHLNTAITLSGKDSIISQPALNFWKLMQVKPQIGERALEIGSGSGYLMAILSRLVGRKGEVIGIELIEEVAKEARKNLVRQCITNATVISENIFDYLKRSPREIFDVIIISAAVTEEGIKNILAHLKENGRLIAPVLKFPKGSINSRIYLYMRSSKRVIQIEDLNLDTAFVLLRGIQEVSLSPQSKGSADFGYVSSSPAGDIFTSRTTRNSERLVLF